MRRNPGHLPAEAIGKRVRVRLRGGREPIGTWAADGTAGCSWRLRNHPFDIEFYEVAT